MASKRVMLAILAIVVVAFSVVARAKEYMVGDEMGWTVDFSYTAWAQGKEFYVGDTLVFKYPAGLHNVYMVSAQDFQSCRVTMASKGFPLTSGYDVITLLEPGRQWYISGVANGQQCRSGMKLVVNVMPASAWQAPAPSPSSPLWQDPASPPSVPSWDAPVPSPSAPAWEAPTPKSWNVVASPAPTPSAWQAPAQKPWNAGASPAPSKSWKAMGWQAPAPSTSWQAPAPKPSKAVEWQAPAPAPSLSAGSAKSSVRLLGRVVGF